MYRRSVLVIGAVAALAGCDAAAAPAPRGPTVVATGLQAPWALAFLPDGTALVTERGRDAPGEPTAPARVLSVTADGRTAEVLRLPTFHRVGDHGVRAQGESGLLGIAVSPDYATDGWIYLYYTWTTTTNRPAAGATATDNRIARFRLGGQPRPILTGIPGGDFHSGGRIAFGPDDMLYAGTGETYVTREIAQDRGSLGGKILRMTPEGKAPADNPFRGSLVWSYGHRNVQGLAWDAAGRMYASELGEKRYDELNLIRRGANYGWPAAEGPGGGYTDPLATWSPTSVASPSGIAVVGDQVYVACLAGRRLYRVSLDGRTNTALLDGGYGRLRDAVAAPDGTLWILTSNRDSRGDPTPDDDRIVRLAP